MSIFRGFLLTGRSLWEFLPAKVQRKSKGLASRNIIPIIFTGVAGGYYYLSSHMEIVPFSNRRRFIYSDDLDGEMQRRAEIKRLYPENFLPAGSREYQIVYEQLKRISGFLPFLYNGYTPDFRITIVEDHSVRQALSFSDGEILLFTGVLQELNQDELALLLCREIGHLVSTHYKEFQRSSWFLDACDIFTNSVLSYYLPVVGQWVFNFRNWARPSIYLTYTKDQEYEADFVALMLCLNAGIDWRINVNLWEKVKKWDKEEPISSYVCHMNEELGRDEAYFEEVLPWCKISMTKMNDDILLERVTI